MEPTIALYNALKSLCGGRVYSDHVPPENKGDDKSKWPAIRFIQIGGSVEGTNCEYGFNPRIQIDIYARDETERLEITEEIEDKLVEMKDFEVVPNSAPIHSFDFDRSKFQAVLDYTFY